VARASRLSRTALAKRLAMKRTRCVSFGPPGRSYWLVTVCGNALLFVHVT
jgi:hypothetical protein